MATKPIIKNITPFDAKSGTRITAVYSGNIPYYNRVVIQDANTLQTVYARTIQTSAYEHYLDPSYKGSLVEDGDVGYALINGRRYTVTIQFFGRNISEDVGIVSDKLSFLTRTTPSFGFEGLESGDTIESASLLLQIDYKQNEYEKLLNYKFMIYNDLKGLLQETEIYYDTTSLTYSFKGLENEKTYYVRAIGTTVNGIELDTGYVQIWVYYDNPSVYSRMYVENNPKTSGMEYHTNLSLIEAEEDDYEYMDGWINLVGRTLVYSQGYNIEGDATWFIRGKEMNFYGDVLICENENYAFRLTSIATENGHYRYKLIVPNGLNNYILYSQELTIAYTDILNIWIRRINNVYTLKVFYEAVDERGDYYFMADAPSDATNFAIYINVDETPGYVVLKDNQKIFYQSTEPDKALSGNVWIE